MENFTPLANLIYNTVFVGVWNLGIGYIFHRSPFWLVVGTLSGIIGYLICVALDYKSMQQFLDEIWATGIFKEKYIESENDY